MRQHKQLINENALSILTLDDDPIITATIQAYFQRSGYHVDVENNPVTAIERVRTGQYDILLLDFLMSPICGDQVVEQIRRFNKDIYIILLTGHKSLAPPIKTIRALDIQGYYEKSDRFDQLELLVESCRKSIRQMKVIRNYKNGLSAVMDTLPNINNLNSLDAVTESILSSVMRFLPCRGVTLALAEDHGSGAPTFQYRSAGQPIYPISSENLQQLLFWASGKSSLLWENQVILPITDSQSNLLGLLSVEPQSDITYDQLQLLEVFARQASSAVSNAKLHSMIQEKNDQLQSNYLELIYTMRRVVDFKDPYTRGHSDRVSFYACQIARFLGRDDAFCERVRVAGLFHDMGKLSIPDDVLLKPARLTDAEFELIKSHSANGAELLSAISQFQQILPAVRSHHERIDGNGYPDRLRGEEIPEEARIIAVADTFDAMTSNRQYRSAMTFEHASEELEHCKGRQLDTKLVEAFQLLIRSQEFWQKAQAEMGDNLPKQLLLDRKMCVGGVS